MKPITMEALHRPLVEDLLRQGARLLRQGEAFDAAAALARSAADPAFAVLCEFHRLVALGDWNAAMRLACTYLARNNTATEVRLSIIETLSQPGTSEAAILPLAAIIAEGEDNRTVAGCMLCFVACTANGCPLNLRVASSPVWSSSLFRLMDDCEPGFLTRVIALALRYSSSELLQELADVLASAPPPVPASRFVDRREAAIQFVPAVDAGARSLLVCLCGLEGRIGMPLNIFHRWVAALPCHALYLRDLGNASFVDGIAELGGTFASMTGFVMELVRALGVEHLAVYGNSMGGFSAAKLGLSAAARRIVVAGGIALPRARGRGTPPTPEQLEAARQSVGAELRALQQRASRPPEILAVYSRGRLRDAADAAMLGEIPGVRLLALERKQHNVASELARTGALGRLLAWAAGSDSLMESAPPPRT